MSPTVVPVLAVDHVVERVRERIADGTLAAGDRVGEADLARDLGVSRTPVREALGRLAAEGLLDLQPNRGARVAVWSSHRLAEVFELRLRLETYAARLAAERAASERIDELDDLADRMRRIGRPGVGQDIGELHRLNRRFHDLLVDTASQPTVAGALSAATFAAVIRHNFEIYDDDSMRRSLGHHCEIVQALRFHDGDWAEAVMRAHLCNARAALLADARPVFGERTGGENP